VPERSTDERTIEPDIPPLAPSELTSNALKHALTKRQKGTIEISIHRSHKGMIIAGVKDDGTGTHDEILFAKPIHCG